MLTTNDPQVAEHANTLRRYGNVTLPGRTVWGQRDQEVPWMLDVQDVHGHTGGHFRMAELEAAVGLVQLGKLERFTRRRRQIAGRLNEGLRDVPGIQVPEPRAGCEHVYHLYPLLVDESLIGSKDDLVRRLVEDEQIAVWLQYCPLYLFSLFRKRGYERGLCPVCEDVFFHRLLNLPIYPQLTEAQIDHMIEAVRRQCERNRGAGRKRDRRD